MTQNAVEPEVALVATTEQEGADWLASHNLDPEGVHIVTDVAGFREHVREKGLQFRLAHDDEGEYFHSLPEELQWEVDRWLFHHPPKR